jgi:hypothetical protein
MIRYYFNNNTTEIVLTNDIDINIVQNRNPNTQQYFTSQDDAIAWANEFVKEINETLVASATKIEQPSEIDLLKQEQFKLEDEVETHSALINSLTDTIVEMSINMST